MADIAQTEQSTQLHAPDIIPLPTPSEAPHPLPEKAQTDLHEPADAHAPAATTAQPTDPAATNNATASATTTTTAPVAAVQASTSVIAPAPVKKFTPVNATRKFLEKTSSSNVVPTSASSPATPGNKPPARSTATPSPTVAPPATTSSKLVSAKLSTMGSPSPGPPSTWARPPSTTAAPSPSPADSPTPVRAQPQPADSAQRRRSASPNKPVWGTPAVPNAPASVRPTSSDFPTAAEASRGWRRNASALIPPPPSEPSPEQIRSDAQKQAMAESAALFRGERLDPNVSHWDEMEDEEDFFQNPIEFGDGTQYNVDMPAHGEQHEQQQQPPPHDPAHLNGASKEDDEGGWTQVTAKGVVAPSSQAGSVTTTATSVKTPSPIVSPHETAPPRALYNDRSNRFEPYNGKPGRGGGPYRRDSRLSDDGRDAPPHRSPTVQLLKHLPGEQQHVKATGPMRTIPSVFDRVPPAHERGREPPSRSGSGFHAPPQHSQRRSAGDMGPPPPPSRRGTNDTGPPSAREPPPHFGRVTPVHNGRDSPVSATSSRMSVRERAPSAASSVAPMSIGKATHEPVPAQPSTPVQPPAPVLSPEEQEELMKKYQHELAEKARRRRLEEEEEREREKERARKKASEIEERITQEKLEKEAKAEAERKEKAEAEQKEKAEEERKEKERVEAERAAATAVDRSSRFDSIGSARGATSFGRPRAPSDRNVGFQPALPARTPAAANPSPADPVMQLDSWRTNAAPPPPRIPRHKPEVSDPSAKAPTPVSKPPPNFVTSLFTNDFSMKDEEVEVLDFSEISKLAPPEAEQSSADIAPPLPPGPRQPIQLLQRPTIGKPLTGSAPPERPIVPLKSDSNAWRKPLIDSLHTTASSDTVSPGGSASTQQQPLPSAPPPSVWARRGPPQDVAQRPPDLPASAPIAKSSDSAIPTSPTSSPIRKHGRTSSTEQVSPRQVPYKEAPLSALTDTMSRIKGALAGMQDAKGKDSSSPSHSPDSVSVTFKTSTFNSGWRERESKGPISQTLLPEDFNSITMNSLIVAPEPGETPVRLPPVSRPRETATKRQMHLWSSPALVRFENLSFDPPVKGMSRRLFVVEEVLFERPKVKQGTTLYRVALPSKRFVNPQVMVTADAPLAAFPSRPPLVGPQGKPPSTFGRASGSVLFGARSRGVDDASWRKPAAPVKHEPAQTELNPMSRSPPPEPESPTDTNLKAQSATLSSGHRVGQAGETPKTPILSAHWGQTAVNVPIINSPSRQAPDPEHLKQVWSQKLDKDGTPGSNSLQGIADEPTRLSFSMQEMKSEDGETPPPTMSSSHSATSITRMSVADAHRAFQQVPTPSSSSSSPKPPQRPPLPPSQSSSHLSASPGRPPPPAIPRIFYPQPPPGAPHLPGPPGPHIYPMPPPAQQQDQRPPINGGTPHPQMAQGWVVGPAGAQQPPQQLLRPPHPGSPYPVQYIAYAPPGAMYSPHPGQSPHLLPKPGPSVAPLPPGAGRGRGMPMMSPVPGPALPHISPAPTPGHILPHMGVAPYSGGPIPSIYHMPPPGAGRPMGQPQPPPPGQPMHGMFPGGPQRPPMPQYPSGAFMHAPQPPFSRPSW